jgi:hypothetical protein
MPDDFEIGVISKMYYIALVSGKKIIDTDNFIPVVQQPLTKV